MSENMYHLIYPFICLSLLLGTPAQSSSEIFTPMPGRVTHIHVQSGEFVECGASLMTVEAMKMQHILKAHRSGYVENLNTNVGDVLSLSNTPIFRISQNQPTPARTLEEEEDDWTMEDFFNLFNDDTNGDEGLQEPTQQQTGASNVADSPAQVFSNDSPPVLLTECGVSRTRKNRT
jgi:pyruvate/2-oxoglutarate dehydrogenase complex dihydrolipoamide acyltransferase (E2) component